MLDFCIYLLYRAGTAIASTLPVRALFAIGNFLGFCAWAALPKYRRLAQRNLEIAFADEKSPRELRRIARRNFQCLSANLLSSLKMISMPLEKLTHYVEAENLDALHTELQAGRPVVLLLNHIGTWELAARYSDTDLNYDVNSLVSADQVRGGDQKIISAGLNFYPNYNVKFMFDWQNVDINRPWSAAFNTNYNAFSMRAQVSL